MLGLINALKSMPPPLSWFGEILEKIVSLLGFDRAIAVAAGIGVGLVGLTNAVFLGYLPMDKIGYVSKDDAKKATESAVASTATNLEKEYRDRLQEKIKTLEGKLDRVVAVEPAEAVIVSPNGDLKFEWTGPADVYDYTLTLLAPDSATTAALRSRDFQLKGRSRTSDPKSRAMS